MSIGSIVILFLLGRWIYLRSRGPAAGPAESEPDVVSRAGRRVLRILGHFVLWLVVPFVILAPVSLLAELAGADPALRDSIENATLLVAFPVTLWLIYIAPHWLAWRILGPAGHLPTARALLWLGPHPAGKHRAGARALLSAAFAVPPVPPDGRRADPWLALALAMAAERQGERRMAEAALAALLAEERLPRRLRLYGLEIAARRAAARGDWEAAARIAARGRGRGARLLRLLARAHRGEPVGRRTLRLAWLFAAERRISLPWVREVEAGRAVPPPALAAAGGSPFAAHLELLALAAAGRPCPAARLVALAASWEGRLGPRAEAELAARALVLGSRDPRAAPASIHQGLLGELEELAAAAVGEWPPVEEGSLAGEIVWRGREQLLARLAAWTSGFPSDGSLDRPIGAPLFEWQSWVELCGTVDGLAALGGEPALRTAWYGAGLRWTACNWPVALGRAHGAAAYWVCLAMHRWSAKLAGSVADPEIAALSAGNAEVVRRSLLG